MRPCRISLGWHYEPMSSSGAIFSQLSLLVTDMDAAARGDRPMNGPKGSKAPTLPVEGPLKGPTMPFGGGPVLVQIHDIG